MIANIVFTGHSSLGRAMAIGSIAHVFIQAQIDENTKESDWEGLVSTKDGKDLCLKTVTFAAVMPMFLELKETIGLDRADLKEASRRTNVLPN